MVTKTKSGTSELLNAHLVNPVSVPALTLALFEQFDSPIALGAYLRLKHNEIDQLVTMEINPNDYEHWADYFRDKQAVSFLRKYPFPGREEICASKARNTFFEGESSCLASNKTLRSWIYGRKNLPQIAESALFAARWKIHNLLGQLDIEKWLDSCRFGPGANLGISGTSDYAKLSEGVTSTPKLAPYIQAILKEYPGWVSSLTYDRDLAIIPTILPGGRYSQVPKDAKTNRNIEVQPSMNTFMQLGLGQLIRRKLLKVHIDLNDQTHNQNLAYIGSVTGDYATIDLSNASDTICTELVRWLLPPDWLLAMEITRTSSILIDGMYRPLERFCSMGNGFAFELESLIFWAISKSACEATGNYERILVYGDDIIVPSNTYDAVCTALSASGFIVNARKSFASGPFRESCGADWFLGHNVRPYFLKEVPTNVATHISLANGLKRVAHRFNCNLGYDRRFARAWFSVIRRIPVAIRKKIAFGFTETDDIILSGRQRDGFRVVFRQTKFPNLNWFPAKAAILYRLWRKGYSALSDNFLDSSDRKSVV